MNQSVNSLLSFMTGIFLCGSIVLLADEPAGPKKASSQEPQWNLKSKLANDAKKRFEQVEKEQKAAFAKAITEAESQLLKDLKVAMQEATKAADLDEALRIRTAIEQATKRREVGGQMPSRSPTKVELPIGKWQMIKDGSVFGSYEFRRDGSVMWTEAIRQAVGKATVMDDAILVVYQDDRTEKITPFGPRLIVEHWHPSSQYPASRPVFVYAEKVK